MKQFAHKKVGIWGFGVVGQSLARYLTPHIRSLALFDQKKISQEHYASLQRPLTVFGPDELMQFLQTQDYIIPSPGIDLLPYQQFEDKFIAELDIFCQAWEKPLIAITGTVGKTSITHILSQLLSHKKVVATGGNIGTGMLDLIAQEERSDCALLELSSFQLDLCKSAAPDLAVITNIYPNHLDRHGSLAHYQTAKFKIFAQQSSTQQALLPFDLLPVVREQFPRKVFNFFSAEPVASSKSKQLKTHERLYYLDQGRIYCLVDGKTTALAQLTADRISYPENWLIIYAVLDLMQISADVVTQALPTLNIPDHRLACIAQHNGISFYNDSKATVPEAMLAAVKKLDGSPIVLFLGGVSKGVDRRASLAQLRTMSVKHVVCFGKEAEQLKEFCEENTIPASSHATLEDAFAYCVQHIAQSADHVLFSPAGASFDLFSHYQERGDVFKKLVQQYCHNVF